jgi:adenosylhomocysteine nucleosidase
MLVVTTFALDSEFAPWRRLRPFRRSDSPLPIYESRIGSVRLRVVLTGIGPHATAAAAAVFRDTPDLCIALGLAGGLNEALRVADVVVPVRVSGPRGTPIVCDRSAHKLALDCGALRIDALYSAPAIVVTAAHKRQLSAIAEAVDMESRTILGESQQRNIPGLALRAISDTANVDLPLDLNRAISPQGHINRSRLLAALLRRPKALPGLVRLGVQGHRAATALSVVLDAYLVRLAGGSERDARPMGSHLSTTI